MHWSVAARAAATVLVLGLLVRVVAFTSDTGVLLNSRLTRVLDPVSIVAAGLAFITLLAMWWRLRRGALVLLAGGALALGGLVARFDAQPLVQVSPDGPSRLVIAEVPGVMLDPLYRVTVQGSGWFSGTQLLGCIDEDWNALGELRWQDDTHVTGWLEGSEARIPVQAQRGADGRWHATGLDACQR